MNVNRDPAEMFELEMDLEKNQYETGGGASEQQLEREVDDAFKKLEELAKHERTDGVEVLIKQAQVEYDRAKDVLVEI